MNDPITLEDLSALLDDELPEARRAAVLAALAGDDALRAAYEALAWTAGVVDAAPLPEPPAGYALGLPLGEAARPRGRRHGGPSRWPALGAATLAASLALAAGLAAALAGGLVPGPFHAPAPAEQDSAINGLDRRANGPRPRTDAVAQPEVGVSEAVGEPIALREDMAPATPRAALGVEPSDGGDAPGEPAAAADEAAAEGGGDAAVEQAAGSAYRARETDMPVGGDAEPGQAAPASAAAPATGASASSADGAEPAAGQARGEAPSRATLAAAAALLAALALLAAAAAWRSRR